jgi:hypothetical protein
MMWILHLVFSSREFGAKVMNLKTLMKALPSLFEHSDKNVRAEVSIAFHTELLLCLRENVMPLGWEHKRSVKFEEPKRAGNP